MKYLRILSALTGWGLLSLGSSHSQGAVVATRAGALEVRVSDQIEWLAQTPLAPNVLRRAGLSLYDGKARQPVALRFGAPARENARVRVTGQTDRSLGLQIALHAVGRCLVWEVACTNTGTEQAWLEIGPWLLFRRAGNVWFFDGWDDFENLQEKRASVRMGGNMPLAAAGNEQVALAVGLEPSQLVSYFRNEYQPLPSGEARVAFVARIVVDPGQTERLSFVAIAAPGQWRKFETFEAYYDSFPTWFRPRADVDPRTHGGGAQYRAWHAGPWAPEICRRLYGSWEWCYAPFRRTGDIVGRPELWEYQPARPFGQPRGLPREQYLAWRKETFSRGARQCHVAMMFYIPTQVWCEERLARERYADALVQDPKAKTYFDTPWVTGHDNELLVFPYRTSFGEQSERDLRQVAEELDLRGFAFDTAGGVARYTGPALPKLEGRAWDEEVGVYCSELVASARLMDFVHTLKKNGQTLAVVANPMAYGSYASCFHADSAMLERNPWTNERTESDRLRWKMGRKTLVWWEEYEVGDFVDLQTITPEQLARVYQGLADFTLLQSLRVGYIPPPNFTQGVARLVRWLPAIVECVQTGWEPVSAVRAPEPLWATRYGRGLKTLIAVAHETGQPVNGEVAVQNQRLGEGAFLFSSYNGGLQQNRVTPGETRLRLNVPVRTPILLRAQAAIVPASAVKTAEVREEIGISKGQLMVRLLGSGAVAVRLRVPAGMQLASVTWNGAPAKILRNGEGALVKGSLRGEARVVAHFRSEHFALEDRDLLEFPFVVEGKPNCAIVLAEGAGEWERRAAFRLQEYFRYWYGRALEPPSQVILPIQEGASASANGLQVRLRVEKARPPRIFRQGPHLVLEATTAPQLHNLMLEMLQALDRKYWTPDWFGQATVRPQLATFRPEG